LDIEIFELAFGFVAISHGIHQGKENS